MSVLSDFLPAGGGGATIARRELFTSNGTWTKPAGLIGDQVWVTMIGGGGSGNASSNRLGGSSGQYFLRQAVDVSLVSSVSVSVGDGGAGVTGSTTNQPGVAGSPSSFGALLTALGAAASPATLSAYIDLNGGNPARPSGANDYSAIPFFGAAPAYLPTSTSVSGASGLLLDDTGIKAEDNSAGSTNVSIGGNGYGAGGGSAVASAGDVSGAGAPGAVLVEWIESV